MQEERDKAIGEVTQLLQELKSLTSGGKGKKKKKGGKAPIGTNNRTVFRVLMMDRRELYAKMKDIEDRMYDQVSDAESTGDGTGTPLRLGDASIRRQTIRQDTHRLHSPLKNRKQMTVKGGMFLNQHETLGARFDWVTRRFAEAVYSASDLPLSQCPVTVVRWNGFEWDVGLVYKIDQQIAVAAEEESEGEEGDQEVVPAVDMGGQRRHWWQCGGGGP